SGCDHAQWYILGFRHPAFPAPLDRHYAIVPRADVTIVDDWDTIGMRGTGSKTLVVERAFVPDHRMEGVVALNTGKSKGFGSNDSAIYHAAFVPHFSIGFAAVAVGAAPRLGGAFAGENQARVQGLTR